MRGSDDLRSASLTVLAARALQRDELAWNEIVVRLQRLVWKSVNVVTSDEEIRRDAFGATWLRLTEHLAKVRDPERLPGWLAVTATREAIMLSKEEQHVRAFDGTAGERTLDASTALPGEQVEQREAVTVVRRALVALGEPCRELLTVLLVLDPPLSYAEVAEHFGRPHGWIGPTRERCMEKLRRVPEVAALMEGKHT